MTKLLTKPKRFILSLIFGLVVCSSSFGAVNIVIQVADPSGVGFNDVTPVIPIGGNNGATLGEQRLNAFQFAADVWGATLTNGPPITIRASWMAQGCSANSGTLGSAGATSIRRDFPNAPFAGTWYSAALANMLSGSDRNGSAAELDAQFNLSVGMSGCLENLHWYYGLDNNHGSSGIDLVTVLLHEFAHGLGFQSFTNSSTGQQAGDTQSGFFPSVYDRFLFDNTVGKTWSQMTDAERVTSAVNTNNLVWSGALVMSDAGLLFAGKDQLGHPLVYAPNPVSTGSSVSHWDNTASPNQLMEPNIRSDLTHSVQPPQDLTFSLLADIGWVGTGPPPSPTPTPSPPNNDNFANAQVISGCTGSVTGSNVGATHEPGEPSHDSANPPDPGAASVWYQWQAPSSGSTTITTAGSDYDTMLGVYTGNSVGALTAIAKNDDVDPAIIITSAVTFNATAGITYEIAVDGWGGDAGSIVLNWSDTGCTQTPIMLTEEGSNRAIAFDSVTQVRGPFPIISLFNFSTDNHTRLMLFTSNLGITGGAQSSLSVQAQDASLQTYTLPVENVGNVPGLDQASYIVVRLTDQLPAGDLLVTVTLRGAVSNQATVGIVR